MLHFYRLMSTSTSIVIFQMALIMGLFWIVDSFHLPSTALSVLTTNNNHNNNRNNHSNNNNAKIIMWHCNDDNKDVSFLHHHHHHYYYLNGYNTHSRGWKNHGLKMSLIEDAEEGNNNNNNNNHNNNNNEQEQSSSSTRSKTMRDLSSDGFGMLLPIAESVDNWTGGWGLSYADLRPETPQTAAGRAFLATNICYAAAGLALGIKGDYVLGSLTEVAGAVSFWYHYSQLRFGTERSEVRLALLTDYITAGTALITGGIYIAQMGITTLPQDTILIAAGSILCLGLCWIWEFGIPYLFWHSMWHILSAYSAFLIGQAHLPSSSPDITTTTTPHNLFTFFIPHTSTIIDNIT